MAVLCHLHTAVFGRVRLEKRKRRGIGGLRAYHPMLDTQQAKKTCAFKLAGGVLLASGFVSMLGFAEPGACSFPWLAFSHASGISNRALRWSAVLLEAHHPLSKDCIQKKGPDGKLKLNKEAQQATKGVAAFVSVLHLLRGYGNMSPASTRRPLPLSRAISTTLSPEFLGGSSVAGMR